MANEVRVTGSMTVRVVSGTSLLLDRRYSRSFAFDATRGPTPGVISVSTSGTDVDLSKLTRPGACWLENLDATNYVDVGIWDPEINSFRPFLEIPPGTSYPVILSRNLGEEVEGTVTGTGTDVLNNTLRLRANGAACDVSVEAYDRG